MDMYEISEEAKGNLANLVIEGVNIDIQSNSEMSKYWEEAKKLVGMQSPAKANPRLENGSNVNIPIILNSAITFGSRAYSVFFRGNDVVKVQVLGNDEGQFNVYIDPNTGQPMVDEQTGEIIKETVVAAGFKRATAKRIGQHMSWQVLYRMDNWVEDKDKLLSLLPIYGSMFTKVYYDKMSKKNVCELIMPKDFIVHAETRDLETSPRMTHAYGLYPYEIKERMASGEFYDVELDFTDYGEQHEIYEQYLRHDLDGDGYDEPIIVWVHSESGQVLKVANNYINADVKRKDGKIINIDTYCTFTKYGFLPNPMGGFYDIGFGYLLYQLNHTLNSITNQLVDAGTLGNSPFFLLERGRLKGGDVKVSAGKGVFVNNDTRPLRDSIYQMNFNSPDGVLLQTFQFLFEYARNLGGMRDVLEGQMRSDQAAGATVMQIEEGMNEFKAIFKRIYRSLSKEYKKLFNLNSKYLDKKEYFDVLDDQEVIEKDDYDVKTYDVEPVADPEYLTNVQRMAQAQFILSIMPNNPEAIKFALESMNTSAEVIDKLLNVPPSDPQAELRMAEVKLEQDKATAMILKEENRSRELDIAAAKLPSEINKNNAAAYDSTARAEARDEEMDLKYYKEGLDAIDRKRSKSMDESSDDKGSDEGAETGSGQAE